MLLDFVCMIVAFIAGVTYRNERGFQEYNKTREEIREEFAKELDYYKNLSESLKNDVSRLKREQIKNSKEN
jgi:hypothetical protein